MAEPSKRKRLSQVNSSSQTSIRSLKAIVASQGDGAEADGDYVEGSILSITMKNFLTYDYSVVHPGPNLNMIVGANGTGKSSIVCAICLGLAGKTTVLGRGDKVGLYVKRGCHKGFIEIELCKKGGNVVIHREIHVENNQSLWMLNGRHCNQKNVEEEVKALRIQVSNLCQFLPQEKVGEFAKMSKTELLEATEKSVGPPEMYEYHCELKNFRNKERELENVVNERASFLEKAKQRNERNKHDVNRYYEKKRHLDVIELLEKKKPWVEYETTRKELEGVRRERDDARRQLAALRQAQMPMLRKIQEIENQLKPTEAQIKAKTAAIKEASNKCKQKQDQLDRKHKEIEDIKQMLRLKRTEEEDHQKRISNTRRTIDDLKAELAKVGDQPDVTPAINAINVELRRIQEERAKIEGEKADLYRERDNLSADSVRLAKKLSDMNNMMNAKEEKLRERHRDTYEALQWLRQNKHQFEGNVHEPMMLMINVRDNRFAKYVENHIAFHDLRAFVFQRKDDMEKFMTEIRDRKNLKVNCISAPEESCSKRQPSRRIESLRRFGFFMFLREMFDAPDEVMSFLCHQYKVHDVPVGNDQTKSMITTVIEEPYLKVLYTTEERYTLKRSFYSNKISTSSSALHPSKYLIITVDAEEKRQLEQQMKTCELKLKEIDERMKALQTESAALIRRDNELLAEKKRLSELKGKKRQLEQKISTKQDSLRQMEQNVIDLKKIEEETKEKIANVNAQKVAIVSAFMAQMKLRAKLTMEKVYLALETVGLTAEKTKLENDCREGASELKTTDQKFNCLEQRKVQLTEHCKGQLRKAKSICRMQSDSLPEDLRNVSVYLSPAFSKLPDTLDEIDAMLNEERSRAECFTGLSESVVDKYNSREQEIKHLEKELEDKSNALNAYRQNISEAKERWLNPLKQLVEQINDKFSDFFRSMQCAGEVDLHAENEEEYDKYGIRIRVKFHSSTQLHELTAHHQSGGERSVSTMLYLMALQELNRCPFRVVDEINQGMDPVNERRVFDIVVRTACKGSTSQYFFITPKLLQNLQYAEEMTILCVHNGAHMLPPNHWDERAFIERSEGQCSSCSLELTWGSYCITLRRMLASEATMQRGLTHLSHFLLWLLVAQTSADLPMCKESDYHFEYTECDVLGSRWRVAVPNKPETCTGLPDPVRGTQCTFSCSEGEFLAMESQQCQKCAAGTYSLGTGVAFDEWDSLPTGFVTHGVITNGGDAHTDCSNSTWTPAGDYIASNTDECTALLSYAVSLKKPGTVSFEYFYPDNSIYFEFFVQNDQCQSTDSDSRWMKISENSWSKYRVELNKGNNVLYWRTTAYTLLDSAVKPVLLRNIAISGVAYTSECFHCKPGTYSAQPGSPHCAPCPADSYSTKGATVCHQCEQDKYSEPGSGSCKWRPACTNSDYFYTHTPCDSEGKTQLMYKWIEPKICNETAEGAVKLPASGRNKPVHRVTLGSLLPTPPPVNPVPMVSTQMEQVQNHSEFKLGVKPNACAKCPVGTEPVVGFEYKWWNTMPSNMKSSIFTREFSHTDQKTAWEVAGEYVYTTPGDQDTDYLMLMLNVPGYRLPQSLVKDSERTELSRITFVFETTCTADCKLYFLAGYNQWNNNVVEQWRGSNRKQSYSYLIHSNSTVSFVWTFQRTETFDMEKKYSGDIAKIYSIHITNVVGGVASQCRHCALSSAKAGSACVPCPPGHYMVNGTGACERCSPNTFIRAEQSVGEEACIHCGPNTKTNKAYSACLSDCTLDVQSRGGAHLQYDFSALANVTSFNSQPRFTNKGLRYFQHFTVGLCGKEGRVPATCVDNVTESKREVKGYVCQSTVVPSEIRSKSVVSSQPFLIGDSLMAAQTGSILCSHCTGVTTDTTQAGISSPTWLFPSESGLPDVIFYYTSSEKTQACKQGRSATIRLRCNPTVTAKDDITLPSNCSEGTCDGCTFHFLWQSQHACPLCTKSHYREIVSACIQGIQRTTYVWQQPLQCYGGETLPAQKVSACVTLDFWLKFGVSTGTIAAVLLISISCYFWKKTRNCAIMEGEDAEDELMDLTKKSFFTKIKSFSRE
ncbi:hypothetical protein INR49_017839, partial [Caranx melampygus]